MLAGGGTGGHLFPALAIARGLRAVDHNCDIRFVGSRYGLEARVLPEENEVFYPLNIRGIQRGQRFCRIETAFFTRDPGLIHTVYREHGEHQQSREDAGEK